MTPNQEIWMVSYAVVAFPATIAIISMSWDNTIMPIWWKRRWSAYLTLFAPITAVIAPIIMLSVGLWYVCNAIAHLIDVATEKDK